MKQRILVVDDQQEWIDFLKAELQAYDLIVAQSSDVALRQLQEDDFALVIANVRRLDVLKAIAEKYPNEHVVVMTVSPTTREAATAYGLGALDYFIRSFKPKTILLQIERAIQLAQRRRSLPAM